MRYAQGGGLTPRAQAMREATRLETARRFACGESTGVIAKELRVTARSVRRWRCAWTRGGTAALLSRGPVSRERLTSQQWARLEAELRRGPLVHGWDEEDQRWTLKRVKTMSGRLVHLGYTVPGVWKLLRRHGWSAQVPTRRAIERDDGAIAVWKREVWPQLKAPQQPSGAGSALRTRPAKDEGRRRDVAGHRADVARWCTCVAAGGDGSR
jgi:putative transposase